MSSIESKSSQPTGQQWNREAARSAAKEAYKSFAALLSEFDEWFDVTYPEVPLQPIKEPVVETEYTVEGLLNIIRRAYPYLKELDSENIDDRSVGMYKDGELDNVTRGAKYIFELPQSPPFHTERGNPESTLQRSGD